MVVGRSDARFGNLLLSRATRFTVDPKTGYVSREDLGSLVALGTSVAMAISNSGLITGSSASSSGFNHAFLFRDGAPMEDIQSPDIAGSSIGLGINNAGFVVGELKRDVLGSRAFLWTPSLGMVDLNDLIDPSLGWTLSAATGINNGSQIVGYGTVRGRTQAFRLDPTRPIVPEPPSLVLLTLGVLSAIVCFAKAPGRVSWERIWSARRRHNPGDIGPIIKGGGRTPG